MSANRVAVGAAILSAVIGVLAGCVSTQPDAPPVSKADPHEAARLNTQLGIEYMREGDMAVAQEKLLRAVDLDSDYAPAYAALGMFYARRSNFDEAERNYRRAMSTDEHSAEIRNAAGAYLCDRGKTDEGLRDLISAAQQLDYGTPEVAWTNAGICAQSAQRLADAEQYFKSALQVNSNYPDALLRLADLSYQKRDYQAAQAYLQRYERRAQPGPDALLLGARIARQLGDTPDAHDYEVKLLQKFPNSDQARELQKRPTP